MCWSQQKLNFSACQDWWEPLEMEFIWLWDFFFYSSLWCIPKCCLQRNTLDPHRQSILLNSTLCCRWLPMIIMPIKTCEACVGCCNWKRVQPLSLQNRFTDNWNNSLWMRDYYRLFWHFLLREVIFRDIDCFLVSFVLEFLGFFLNFRNFFLTLRNSKWKWKYKSIKMA